LPLGLAEHLALAGCRVSVVTSAEAVGTRLGTIGTADFGWIYPRVKRAGVEILTSKYVDRIDAGSVTLLDVQTAAETALQADTVIPVMLRFSNDALYRELAEAGVNVVRLGDCVAPRDADDALFEGTREGHAVEARAAAGRLAAV
ncbi:MAG: hypothetical protein ABUU24_05490, partial [Variovorax sp.]